MNQRERLTRSPKAIAPLLPLGAVVLALSACHSGSGSGALPLPGVVVTNQGLAGEWLTGGEALRLVAVSEELQGRDLDGDGDTDDLVAHLLDLEAGTLVNSGLALRTALARDEVPPPFNAGASDDVAVFVVSEVETGRDLDGDGELESGATWAFERGAGRLTEVGPANLGVALDGPFAVFLFQEGSALRLRVFDARDGSLTLLPGEPRAAPLLRRGVVAYVVSENGNVDLNLDGDRRDDAVLQYYDAEERRSVNTAWSTGFGIRLAGHHLATHVPESAQGGADLDGDGLALSSVFVVVDTSGGGTRIPDLQVKGFADFDEQQDPERFLLEVRERPGEDRNRDGDSSDVVVVVYDPRTNRSQDTGLATRTVSFSAGRWIGVPVYEFAQGARDLDGDGAVISDILHVYDTETGQVLDLGFEAHLLGAFEGTLLLLRLEHEEDWNGDGDTDDLVLFAWSAGRHTAASTGLAIGALLGSTGGRVLVSVSEAAQQADLDGDGDRDDLVLALFDGSSGRVLPLGLATDGRDVRLGVHGAAVLVPEQSQGVDLNGDGDLLDRVLHTLVFDE